MSDTIFTTKLSTIDFWWTFCPQTLSLVIGRLWIKKYPFLWCNFTSRQNYFFYPTLTYLQPSASLRLRGREERGSVSYYRREVCMSRDGTSSLRPREQEIYDKIEKTLIYSSLRGPPIITFHCPPAHPPWFSHLTPVNTPSKHSKSSNDTGLT